MEIICFLLLLFLSIINDVTLGVKDVVEYKMEALRGETSYLPCNVSTYDGDDVVLILWYREDKGTPIYSVDIRGGISKAAKRWSDETIFGERAYFMFDREPGKLSIQKTQDADTGIYRCRVDFLKAQTRNSRIKLTVIAPPEQVLIRDGTDVERSTVVGPYAEGDIVTLKCEAIGGKPIPKINWFRDDVPIVSETAVVPGERYVQNEITLGPLGREDLNSKLNCRASNHPRATPIETAVQIDMNFAPLNIRLLGAHQPLSAGRRYDLLCQSAGSRPPAVITWWQNGLRLEKTTETTSSDGNQTTSTLSIVLSKSDAGKYLSCKSYNHAVPSDALEDGWTLDIQYVPEPYVRLGTSLDPNSIREGTDVYFDCLVIAHPSVFRIEWRHNGRPLPHNISQGVIVSNHSLVLQGVTRATAGNYSCVGFNSEGEGSSPPFKLNILYAPTCAPNQPRIYGIAKQEDAKVKCTVDANPPEVEFSWTFNNSAESIDVATNHIARSGTSSVVTYTPITELDYGTLLCIATNKIGRQRVPCVFHIIAAGRPDQVHNCTLTNISMTSLTVTCSDGFNGGLPQMFILELKDIHTNEIKANITSTVPRFTVSALAPGSVYILSVFAFNSKGRSDATTLNAAMLRMPEKQLTSEQAETPRTQFLFSPVISLTIGLTLAIMVAGLAVVLALRIPCKNSRRRRPKELNNENTSRDGSPGPSDKSSGSKELDGNESDEKNPDVVPESMDSDDQLGCMRKIQHISTIDAGCSPTRGLLSASTPPPQKFAAAGMTLHTSHNLGYCTLRNGIPTATSTTALPMNVTPHIYSNSIAQCTLPRHSGGQQMWPRYNVSGVGIGMGNVEMTMGVAGISGMSGVGGGAGGGGVGVRGTLMQPLTALHQMTKPHPQMQLAMHAEHQLNAATTLGGGLGLTGGGGVVTTGNTMAGTLGRTIALQHLGQGQRTGRLCIGLTGNPAAAGLLANSEAGNCLSDDEVTAQTPLMTKRESTV